MHYSPNCDLTKNKTYQRSPSINQSHLHSSRNRAPSAAIGHSILDSSLEMSHQSPSQHQPLLQSRPPPTQPATRRRLPPTTNPLSRRPGPPGRMPSAPAGPSSGRLRDVSLASLLEGVDQVPSARKRLLPTPTAGVIASGASRPGVMQAKIPQRYLTEQFFRR